MKFFKMPTATMQYWQRVKSLYPTDLLALWPLDDVGSTARDVSANNITASYGGNITSRRNIWRGGFAPDFSAGVVNLNGTNFNSLFNRAEFSINFFISPTAWANGAFQRVCYFYVDASNYISVYLSTGGSLYCRYMANGTDKLINVIPTTWPVSGWPMITFTVSKSNDRMYLYIDGCLAASTTGLGTISSTAFGNYTTDLVSVHSGTFGSPFVGKVSNFGIWNRELSGTEIIPLLAQNKPVLSIIGDSIETWSRTSWFEALALTRGYRIINHAVSGNNINVHMQTQCDAAVNDNASLILIALGTNDNSDVDSTITVYANAVATLQNAMPNSRIFGMQILDKHTPGYRTNNNVRIATACSQRGITTINVDGVVTDPDDLADGLHPNDAGALKIYNYLCTVITS
jgi:hypothetical protein